MHPDRSRPLMPVMARRRRLMALCRPTTRLAPNGSGPQTPGPANVIGTARIITPQGPPILARGWYFLAASWHFLPSLPVNWLQVFLTGLTS
jgi:hypothetical protein